MASNLHRSHRFLLITPDFPPSLGGIQTWLHALCTETRRLSPVVVVPFVEKHWEFDATQSFPIIRSRGQRVAQRTLPNRYLTLALTIEALRASRSRHCDIVIAGHVLAAPAALTVSRTRHIPYVLITHAMELRTRRSQLLVRSAIRLADRIITNSSFTRNECIRLGASPERVYQTPLGVHALNGSARAESALSALQTKWGRLSKRRLVLTVARLTERYKGHDMMIHALPLVAAQVPEVQYVIVGEGRHKTYYQSLARSLGVADRVTFAGAVNNEDLCYLYDACDVFALCSRERLIDGGAEGFGIVFIEANAHGKPVLAGRSGGVLDAVVDGVTGVLVNPLNELEIAGKLVDLLNDPGLARRLGEQGRHRAITELTWTRVIGGIEKVLLEVVESRGKREESLH